MSVSRRLLALAAIALGVALLPLPAGAQAAGGPQFLERAPLEIPLARLKAGPGSDGWAVEVVNPGLAAPIDAQLRLAGPVSASLAVRAPATVRIAPGAVATFHLDRVGPARAGRGELVVVAGGAVDRRQVAVLAPPPASWPGTGRSCWPRSAACSWPGRCGC